MPLVRFEVKNEFGFGDPELYSAAAREDSKAVLEGVAVAGLVGMLKQLGDLTEFAADIFHDLHEQVTATSARGCKMFTRIKHIEAALPSLEKTIHGQRSHIHFAYAAGADWHADPRSEQSQLFSTDLPRFMMDSYEECQDPPRLYLLDKFDTGGSGACLKRYSDPSYFKRAWAISELGKAEKEKKEMKVQKIKKKRSRLKKGEVQNAVSSSWRGSSARFPSIDEHYFSTETTSISDIRFKPELASTSTSFGSRTMLNVVEQVPDTNSSMLPDGPEYDRLTFSKLQINKNNPSSDVPNGSRGDDNDDIQDQTLHRSPSVTWDEKTEIVTPGSPKPCDDTLAACQNTKPPQKGSEQPDMEHETANFGTLDQDKYDVLRMPLPLSSRNHLDEPASETDNYMDALNTMEPETETDYNCQTKRELRSQSNFNCQKVESDTPKLHGMATRNSDFIGTKTSAASQKSLNGDESLSISYLVPSVHLDNTTGCTPDPNYSASYEFLEDNALHMSRSSGFEGINGDQLAQSSLCNQCIPRLMTNTSEFWTNGNLLGLEPSKPPVFSVLNNESKDTTSGFKNSKCDQSNSMGTTKLHCSGMAKSEPVAMPNESLPLNSSSAEMMDGLPYTSSYFNCRDLGGHKLFERMDNAVQQINPPRFSQSPHYNKHDSLPVKQKSHRYLQALSLNESDNTQDTSWNNENARLDVPDIRVANADELSGSNNVKSQQNEFDLNTKSISSHLSDISQRVTANGLQIRASITEAYISKPSEVMDADISIPLNTLLQNHDEGSNRIVYQPSFEQKTNRKATRGSSKDSISSYSHYSGHSSPPLEHMKISFHPMNGLETSKLKLEFPNGTFHNSSEDLMFPSFQLLPGSIPPLQVSCSESDDDTFCRSCPDTSEDYLSPHSDSNSDLWGQNDKVGSKNSELYNDLRRISLSSESTTSFRGTDQMSQIGLGIGFGKSEAESGISYFQSSNSADLPGLDCFIPRSSEGQGKFGSFPTGPEGFDLQSPDEQPLPPPLPPMQWRMTKTSFTEGVDGDSIISHDFEHSNIEHGQKFTFVNQQEKTIPRPPPLPETMAHTNMRTKGQQKLNGLVESNHDANGKELEKAQELTRPIQDKNNPQVLNGDEETRNSHVNAKDLDGREDIFHQIRNKNNPRVLNRDKEIRNSHVNAKDLDGREDIFHQIRNKHDRQKLNAHQEPSVSGSNGQEGGEREDLLYQIRNKAFNLRRTTTAKPIFAPQATTNINVVAILEKANAIRQAFVGSDDENDDDIWSDR